MSVWISYREVCHGFISIFLLTIVCLYKEIHNLWVIDHVGNHLKVKKKTRLMYKIQEYKWQMAKGQTNILAQNLEIIDW